MDSVVTFCLTLILCFTGTRSQFDTGMSGDRRTVVQLFEWPFNDIKEECKNVLGPQKFGAVLVSPIAENALMRTEINGKIIRPWFERYQPLSWNIISRSGSEQEFQDMVKECNKNDVRVYVDAVFNHGVGAFSGDAEGVGGTHANAKTRNYPGLGYEEKNFHTPCTLDYTNTTSIRICELAGLQDVNQTQPYVQSKIATFLNKLIAFGVAGFRIDAAKHMWPEDLRQIYNQLNNVSLNGGKTHMRPYWTLDVIDSDGSFQEDYKDIGSEYDSNLSWRVWYAFKIGNTTLSDVYKYAKHSIYQSKTVQDFSVNHDFQRFFWRDGFWNAPSRSGIQQIMYAFVLTFSKNVPNIFSGYSYKDVKEGPPANQSESIIPPSSCSNGWLCEHRFKPLQWVNKFFTNFVKDAPVETWWSNWGDGANQAAFTRGKIGFAVFNAETKDLKKTFDVSLPAGVYCDLATGYYCHMHQMCMGWLQRKVEVKADGTVEVSLPGITRSESLNHQLRDTQAPPPYLVISVQSMYPPDEVPDERIEIIGWCILGVVVVVAIAFVTWFFLKQSDSRKTISLTT